MAVSYDENRNERRIISLLQDLLIKIETGVLLIENVSMELSGLDCFVDRRHNTDIHSIDATEKKRIVIDYQEKKFEEFNVNRPKTQEAK